MKLFKILKPKTIILDESLLTNEFSIGFELEAIIDNEDLPRSGLPSYHSGSQVYGNAKIILDKLNEMLGLGEGHIESDSSVSPVGSVRTASGHEYNDSIHNSWGFEYVSPIIKFTPTNIAKISKFLKGLKNMGIVTNDHCGFHTHISYPDINKKDVAWALFCIANDNNMYKEVSGLDEGDYKINFFAQPYATSASFDELKNLGDDISHHSSYANANIRVSDKYRMMRVHPQGTIEWRGPRNFINDGSNEKLITDYLKKLHKVISFIGDVVTRKEYNGFDKNEVLKRINVIGEFNSDYEKRIQEKGKGLVSSLQKNPEKIASMPDKILKQIFSSDADTVNSLISTSSNVTSWIKDNTEKIKPETLKKILKYVVNSNAVESYIASFIDAVTRQYDAVSENISEDLIRDLFNRELVDRTAHIMKKFIVKDQNLLMQVYKRLKDSSYCMDFLKLNQKYLPISIYMDIAKNNPTWLSKFDNVPVKVQRRLIKGTPYSIQYIRHPDPSIIEFLKSKYGEEIADYILDEV